jgi:parvulin-like peptidyl-prolyl isomerase
MSETQNTSSKATPSQKDGVSKGTLILSLVGGLFVLVLLYTALTLLVHRFDDRPFAQAVARVMPIPAAIVDGRMVTMHEFILEGKLTESFIDFNAQDGTAPVEEVTRGQVLDGLVAKTAAIRIARKQGISVSQEEIDEYFSQLAQQAGMTDEIARDFITAAFATDLQTYKNRVIRPELYRSKLAEAVQASEELLGPVNARAEALYARLVSGEITFEDAAQESSEDPSSAQVGGDIGYFNQVSIPEDVREQILALEEGEFTPVLETEGGRVIIKVERKVAEGGTFINEATGEEQVAEENLYRIKGIFFFVQDIDSWIKAKQDAMSVRLLVRRTLEPIKLLTEADRKKAAAALESSVGIQEGDVLSEEQAGAILEQQLEEDYELEDQLEEIDELE